MRGLRINQQCIHYATFTGTENVVDENGYETGEKEREYGTPTELWINLSPAKGRAAEKMFGLELDYTRTMTTCDMSLPITETTVLWVEETDTSKPYDYIVRGIAKGLNSVVYAIKKVR